MTITNVSNANEAGYMLNALAYVAQEGQFMGEEVDRIRTYFDEYYQRFGQAFVDTLKDRIKANTLTRETMYAIAPSFDWNAWGRPGFLVAQVDQPYEAGLLINAMAWVAEAGGFAQGEVDRIAEYFDEYVTKFGDSFIIDLQGRISAGELSAETMRMIAPNYYQSW